MKRLFPSLVLLLSACASRPDEPARAEPEPSPAASTTEIPRHSKAPKQEEWKKDGVPYPVVRAPKRCSALALREWIRVRCEQEWAHAGYTKFGPTDGVEIWQGKFEKGLFAVFPFRPGDRRVIVFTDATSIAKYGAVESPANVISMTWLEGEQPILTID